jgi:hypothetical protein
LGAGLLFQQSILLFVDQFILAGLIAIVLRFKKGLVVFYSFSSSKISTFGVLITSLAFTF